MQVETFECSETAAETVDASAEAIEIIEKLGLTGQKELVCPAKAEGQQTRFPYREMLADEAFAYVQLCPAARKLSDYKASPVPLRVLQIAAHAQELMPECRLMVWDRAAADTKDPVLVAEIVETYSVKKRFILARWGEVLEAFPVLLKRAIQSHRETLNEKAEGLLNALKQATDKQIVEVGDLRDWVWKI